MQKAEKFAWQEDEHKWNSWSFVQGSATLEGHCVLGSDSEE
jgi:hypothetical protein